MITRNKWAQLLLLLFMVVFLTACQPSEIQMPPDELTVQLKWVHQAQFAGFYLAQEKGYYAEENLAVTLVEGGPEINVLDQVTVGAADFGIDAPENIIIQRSQSKPVVAIAAIYRRSPLVFITLANSGIEQPYDFLDQSVALASDGQVQFEALLKRLDLDIAQVEFKPYEYDHTSLYNGQVDITYAYANGGLIRIRQSGYDVNLIWPSDYGIHFYADTLITSDQMIEQNPELVTRFLRATLRGWLEAIENPEAAVSSTLQVAREPDAELQMQMMEASVPLIHTGQDQIGWMRQDVWQGMQDMLLEQGLLSEPVAIDRVYTMTFLEAVYGGEQ